MLVKLPSNVSLAGADMLMAAMFTADGNPVSPAYELDFSSLRFIETTGVASLANAIDYATSKNCRVAFVGLDPVTAPIAYLDDSGFFLAYLGASLREGASLRSSTAPMQRVAHAESYFWIENRFAHWLARQLLCESAELASVHACMKEIFNNIDNHSGERVGCAVMQHFPNRNEVVIAVADFGVGIPTAIRRTEAVSDDGDALLKASTLGVTSRSTRGNQGIGLDHIIRVIANTNKGRVRIRSGRGMLRCGPGGQGEERTSGVTEAFYPGTMVEIRLDTNKIVLDPVERESLEW